MSLAEEDVHVHSVKPGSAKRSKVKVLRDLEDKVAEVFDSLEDDAIVLAFYIGHGSLTLEGYTNVHDLHFQLEPRLLSQAAPLLQLHVSCVKFSRYKRSQQNPR